jgi:hypothetical protein
MKKIFYLCSTVLLATLLSCGATETKVISSGTIEMMDEYAMEGSNTLTGVWKVDTDGINIDNIKSVKVTAVKVEMNKPGESGIMEGVIMQLAASGTDMQRVAVLNPIPEGKKGFDLSIAAEQENLAELLMQEEITFVADINLKEDPAEGLSIGTTINFEIEVTQ